MHNIGFGILTWNASERRSGRYGYVYLHSSNYAADTNVAAKFNFTSAKEFVGKRVKLTCKVIESRSSGHCGDMFLNIKPSTPEVGEVIELGVGDFDIFHQDLGYAYPYAPEYTFGLKPNDNRDKNWFDPRILYRLHDQIVELYIEETTEPHHDDPKLDSCEQDVAVAFNDGNNIAMQVKTKMDKFSIEPQIENHGDGLFSFSPPKPGEFTKVRKKN